MPLEQEKASSSALGIVNCLHMLAQEAAALNLVQTVDAIELALAAARLEAKPRLRLH
jgi:hypothetical protein